MTGARCTRALNVRLRCPQKWQHSLTVCAHIGPGRHGRVHNEIEIKILFWIGTFGLERHGSKVNVN